VSFASETPDAIRFRRAEKWEEKLNNRAGLFPPFRESSAEL
jgi:hypothetical protein